MPSFDLKIEARIGVKHKSCRILSILSVTRGFRGDPVDFFVEDLTRALLMFTEERHRVALAPLRSAE